jgi:hypothetical protein
MNELLEKYNDYMRLEDCVANYELKDGTIIEISYKEENFAHLIGLHKLKDLQLIQFWLDKNNKTVKLKTVLKRIKNSTFTDSMVKSSIFYHKIQTRYENFSYNNLTTLNYTDAIINFNPKIINSKIKSDYLLFEKKSNTEYNHMGIALDKKSGTRYIETFFHESTDKYISRQTTIKVKTFTLYDKNGKIIVTDSF